jgi:hypothetical protein
VSRRVGWQISGSSAGGVIVQDGVGLSPGVSALGAALIPLEGAASGAAEALVPGLRLGHHSSRRA